jgi:hypothetical protein
MQGVGFGLQDAGSAISATSSGQPYTIVNMSLLNGGSFLLVL